MIIGYGSFFSVFFDTCVGCSLSLDLSNPFSFCDPIRVCLVLLYSLWTLIRAVTTAFGVIWEVRNHISSRWNYYLSSIRICMAKVSDVQVDRAGVSVTWNVLSWSGVHEFEPQSDWTWDMWEMERAKHSFLLCPILLSCLVMNKIL